MPRSLPSGPITADQPTPPVCRASEVNDPPDSATQELCPLQEWGCTTVLRQPSWQVLSSHSISDGEVEYCKCSCNAIERATGAGVWRMLVR